MNNADKNDGKICKRLAIKKSGCQTKCKSVKLLPRTLGVRQVAFFKGKPRRSLELMSGTGDWSSGLEERVVDEHVIPSFGQPKHKHYQGDGKAAILKSLIASTATPMDKEDSASSSDSGSDASDSDVGPR